MKLTKMLRLLLFLIVFLPFSGCRKTPPQPLYPPNTKIISPTDYDTLTNAQVLCEWEGLENAVEYQYKLDSLNWSDWINNTKETFFLDEAMHIFTVTSRNEFNREDPSPAIVNFYVDAITGPALWLKKREMEVDVLQASSLKVFVEDITNLMLANLELLYDNSKLKIENVLSDSSFLAKNGGQIQMISEFSDSLPEIKINIGITGGTPGGVSGSGPLVKLLFFLKSADTTEITFSSSSELRDTLNSSITLTGGLFSCKVIPKQ